MGENYHLLDDMKKYNPNFNSEEWKNKSQEETIGAFREIYKALGKPIDVTTWIRLYDADEKYIYAKAQGNQICFVRDVVAPMFYDMEYDRDNYKEYSLYRNNFCKVINSHMSKSVMLPVYNFKSEKYDVEITMRNNFYDWKISIESSKEIECDFMGLFNEDDKINPIYCEGMEAVNKVYGCYSENKKRFTFEPRSDYEVYTLMFLLKAWLRK